MDIAMRSEEAERACSLVEAGRLFEALGYLNGLTGHRYTAIYIREGARAWNALLFDAENEYSRPFPEVAAEDTYCSIAIAERQVVVIPDSLLEARTVVHAARDVVRSYCGAPLFDADGHAFGTLCHFDARPVPTTPGTGELLVEVARRIGRDAVSAGLLWDVERRLQRIADMLGTLPEGLRGGLRSGSAFDQLADPLLQILPRLEPAAAAGVTERLQALRGSPAKV